MCDFICNMYAIGCHNGQLIFCILLTAKFIAHGLGRKMITCITSHLNKITCFNLNLRRKYEIELILKYSQDTTEVDNIKFKQDLCLIKIEVSSARTQSHELRLKY